jgi:FHS family L-fucose permease-like MFS transporter
MKYVPAERMLLYCSIGSVVSIILVILTGIAEADETVSWTKYLPVIFLMFNYLFEAIMFPTIFSLALKNLGGLTKTASSLLMMTPVGGCGFLLMGYLADSTTLIIPFVIPLIGYFIVLLFAKRALQKL